MGVNCCSSEEPLKDKNLEEFYNITSPIVTQGQENNLYSAHLNLNPFCTDFTVA